MVERGPMPPGWEMKWDTRRGRAYFVNHTAQTTSWFDPRVYGTLWEQHGMPLPPPSTQSATHYASSSAATYQQQQQLHLAAGRCTSASPQPPVQRRSFGQQFPSDSPPLHQPAGRYQRIMSASPAVTTRASSVGRSYSVAAAGLAGAGVDTRDSPLGRRPAAARAFSREASCYSPEATPPAFHQPISDSPATVFNRICTVFPHMDAAIIRILMKQYNNREDVVCASLTAATVSSAEADTGGGNGSNSDADSDLETSVAKITAMFPTVSEDRVRQLLKRYHQREAVVISALQVQRHPLVALGPTGTPPSFRSATLSGSVRRLSADDAPTVAAAVSGGGAATPASSVVCSPPSYRTSPPRMPMSPPLSHGSCGWSWMSPMMGVGGGVAGVTATSGGGGAVSAVVGGGGSCFSPRPGSASTAAATATTLGGGVWPPRLHSSPKMKLRYMKSVFPKSDETFLLDILTNCDNNVQTATDKLSSMGYSKSKEPVVPPRYSLRHQRDVTPIRRVDTPSLHCSPRTRMLSEADRNKVRQTMEMEFASVSDTLLKLAIEAAGYDLQRARHVLDNMVESARDAASANKRPVGGANKQADKSSAPASIAGAAADKRKSPKRVVTLRSPKKTVADGASSGKSGADKRRSVTSLGSMTGAVAVDSSSDEDLIDGNDDAMYRSMYRQKAAGHNSSLVRGPQPGHLLCNYVEWSGTNASLRRGADAKLRAGPQPSNAKGCDSSLRRGPTCSTIKQYNTSVHQTLVTSP